MDYRIRHLDRVSLESKLYLFDANLWIKILTPPFSLSARDKKYLTFFQKFKNDPKQPKVVVTSLILAEVINRIIREMYLSKYFKDNPEIKKKYDSNPEYRRSFYKKEYRTSNHFKDSYKKICEEISNYEKFCVYENDEFGVGINALNLLSMPPSDLDFNDNYFVELAKLKGYLIVTDDGDFFIEGVDILTYNDTLYQKMKDKVKPSIASEVKEVTAFVAKNVNGNTLGDIAKVIEAKKK